MEPEPLGQSFPAGPFQTPGNPGNHSVRWQSPGHLLPWYTGLPNIQEMPSHQKVDTLQKIKVIRANRKRAYDRLVKKKKQVEKLSFEMNQDERIMEESMQELKILKQQLSEDTEFLC